MDHLFFLLGGAVWKNDPFIKIHFFLDQFFQTIFLFLGTTPSEEDYSHCKINTWVPGLSFFY